MSLDKWKERIYEMNPNMELLTTEEEFINPYEEQILTLHCNKCNETLERTVKYFTAIYSKWKRNDKTKIWCPSCNNTIIIPGKNDLATLRPDLLKYFINPEEAIGLGPSSNKKIIACCPECGNLQSVYVDNLYYKGFKCQQCSDSISYPNKFCRELLKHLPVEDSESEYIREWTQTKKYDGYFKFNNIKYLLEFDGLQHFMDTSWSTKKEQQENDRLKDKLAKENGFELIRIDCKISDFEYIKNNIYKSELNNLFDLDNIDWNKIFDNTLKNEFLQVIEFYKNHRDFLRYEIANEFNIGPSKVTHYLQKANELGMIEYETQHNHSEKTKQTILNTRRERSQNIFETYSPDGELIGTFSLITDCARALNEKYPNITFDPSGINRCLQTGKPYKNITFKYINKHINHFRTGDRTKEICDYFLNNQEKTDNEIANELNISRKLLERYRDIGINIGLITLDNLKECAFNHGRLKNIKNNERSD